MNGILVRWLLSTFSLMITAYVVKGIEVAGFFSAFFAAALLGILNAFIRPLFILITLPINILTLGLFTLVINTLLFALTGWIGNQFGIGFTLAEPWLLSAFLGSLVTTLISGILNGILGTDKRIQRRKSRS